MTAQEAAKLINYAFLLYPPLLVLFVVGNVWYLKRMRGILSYLEQKHAAAWEALGKPTVFKNNTPANSLNILRFLYRREFTRLADDALTAKCEGVRRLLLSLAIAEVTAMVLFVIMCVLDSTLRG